MFGKDIVSSRRRIRNMYMYASGQERRIMRKKIPAGVLIPCAFFSSGSFDMVKLNVTTWVRNVIQNEPKEQ